MDKEEVYVCQFCGKQSTEEKDFQTDVDSDGDNDGMTCEQCYDGMNE